MDIDAMITSSPTENKKHDEQPSGKPVSGLLFTHGTQAIPDSLNASLSTTGYEESDFPHCIDSSLLLSPKADEPMIPACDNPDVLSQDVPNFLSGFRKTGLSFFGGGNATTSEPNPDSSAPNDAKAAKAAGALRSGPGIGRQGPGHVMRSVDKAMQRGFAHRMARREADSPLAVNNNNTTVYNFTDSNNYTEPSAVIKALSPLNLTTLHKLTNF